MSKRVAILLADGFEEIEALGTCDFLRRIDFDASLVRVGEGGHALGAHNMRVECDMLLSALNVADYDALVLPGGMPGSINLRDNDEVIGLVKSFYAEQKVVAAICAAPIVLDRAGLLTTDVVFTAYPNMDDFYGANKPTNSTTESCCNIVTGRGPGATLFFAAAIAEKLGASEQAEATLKGMLVK